MQNNLSSTSENETCKQALGRMNFLQHCLNYKGSSKSVEELSFHFMTESPTIGTSWYRSIDQSASFVFAKNDSVFYVVQTYDWFKGSLQIPRQNVTHISKDTKTEKIERKKDIPWGEGGGVD